MHEQVTRRAIELAGGLRHVGARHSTVQRTDNAIERGQVLGIQELALIARELVAKVKQNVTIDWTTKETVRAKICVLVRRILKQHGHPPDLQVQATQTVLEQTEVLCADWAS